MRIAQFKGKSAVSKAIRWITRSEYSHSAFVFDEQASLVARGMLARGQYFRRLKNILEGAVVEAWQKPNGVQNPQDISTFHTGQTPVDFFDFAVPLTLDAEEKLIRLLDNDIGFPYGFANVLRFVTRKPGNLDDSWFCSELVFQRSADVGRQMFSRTEAWEVAPGLIPRSPLLREAESVLTV